MQTEYVVLGMPAVSVRVNRQKGGWRVKSSEEQQQADGIPPKVASGGCLSSETMLSLPLPSLAITPAKAVFPCSLTPNR